MNGKRLGFDKKGEEVLMQTFSGRWKGMVRDQHQHNHLKALDTRRAKCRVRMTTEPKCPPGQPPSGDGAPPNKKQPPRLWVVKPMPKTQVLIFPNDPDTFEAVQSARISATIAEKSASLTDELNRQVWERVQTKRAARAAAQ